MSQKRFTSGMAHLNLAAELCIERDWLIQNGMLKIGTDSPFHRMLDTANYDLWKKVDLDRAEFGVLKLRWPRERLEELRQFDPKLSKGYLRKLRSPRLDDYFGTMCELNTATLLAKHNFKFTQPDPPDFAIEVSSSQTVFIECTTAHRVSEDGKDLHFKIADRLTDKKKKPYATSSCTVVIDFTNIMFLNHEHGHYMGPDTIKKRMASEVQQSGFGCVIFQTYAADRRDGRYLMELVYERIDVENILTELKTVLDTCFPRGVHTLAKPMFPRL